MSVSIGKKNLTAETALKETRGGDDRGKRWESLDICDLNTVMSHFLRLRHSQPDPHELCSVLVVNAPISE